MEIFFQFLFEIYLNIGDILVPDKKFKKWQESLLKVLCVVVCCVILGCLGAGIAFLTEGIANLRATGIALVCVGAALLAVQIALLVIAVVHDVKKRKSEKQDLNF